MKFRPLELGAVPWGRLDVFLDRNVFQTRAWLEFVSETQQAAPVVAELLDGSSVVGYFSGLVFHRLGVKVLGSSFPGWTTPYIGFNLDPGVPRTLALEALENFAFGELKCLHLEVCDRQFQLEDGRGLGFEHDFFESYETDLTQSEEALLKQIDKSERWSIRKAEKCGVTVEPACDPEFADEYYEQLQDVFGRKGRVPTYGVDRVRALIKHLLPSGNLLLLRARRPDGPCIATSIYLGMNKVADFWGNASLRSGHQHCPNQALHWYALRYWKCRRMEIFDWGGGGTYKEKYGPRPIAIPRFRKSRYRLLGKLRSEAQRLVAARQRVRAGLQRYFG